MDVRQAGKLNIFSTPSAITKATFIPVDNIFFECISCNYFIGSQETDRLQFIFAQHHPFFAIQELQIYLYVHSKRQYIQLQKYFPPFQETLTLQTVFTRSSVFCLALLS